MDEITFTIFILSSVIQSYFWIGQLGRLARKRPLISSAVSELPHLTLLIAAQNERINLERHMPHWLNQEYPNYDIIIIDDHSSDGSREFLKSISSNHLKVLHLPDGQTGKKSALSVGINHSTTDWIITTDADCFPSSKEWLKEMMSQHKHADVILGYSPIKNIYGTLLGSWISYETWYIAIQYMTAVLNKRAYMGVGRNLAFRKNIYNSVGGYNKHMHIKSGDDDLFISSLDSTTRYRIVTSAKAWVWTYAAASIGDYIRQKRRHLTTAPKYKTSTKIWLTILYVSHLFWYLSLLWLCLSYPWMIIFFFIRGLIILSISAKSKNRFNLMPKYWLAPVNDFFLCFLYLLLSLTFLFPKREW